MRMVFGPVYIGAIVRAVAFFGLWVCLVAGGCSAAESFMRSEGRAMFCWHPVLVSPFRVAIVAGRARPRAVRLRAALRCCRYAMVGAQYQAYLVWCCDAHRRKPRCRRRTSGIWDLGVAGMQRGGRGSNASEQCWAIWHMCSGSRDSRARPREVPPAADVGGWLPPLASAPLAHCTGDRISCAVC